MIFFAYEVLLLKTKVIGIPKIQNFESKSRKKRGLNKEKSNSYQFSNET